MAPERFADPEVTQALEELEDTLRTERRALGPLLGENVRLQAKLERLKARRDQLQEELQGLRTGRARNHPRLPEVLVPPFKVRPAVPVRRQLRMALPSLALLVVLFLILEGQSHVGQRIFVLFAGIFVLLRFFGFVKGRSWWNFSKVGIRGGGKEADEAQVPYSRIIRVKVEATPSQRRRGVGTVQVTYEEQPGEGMERTLTLKDVPEPERLASWLREKRSPRLGASG
jgi:membrane protein YdbS with pleckstrin-like domain